MIPPGFNKEKYMNQHVVEDGGEAPTTEAAKPMGKVAAEEAGEDVA